MSTKSADIATLVGPRPNVCWSFDLPAHDRVLVVVGQHDAEAKTFKYGGAVFHKGAPRKTKPAIVVKPLGVAVQAIAKDSKEGTEFNKKCFQACRHTATWRYFLRPVTLAAVPEDLAALRKTVKDNAVRIDNAGRLQIRVRNCRPQRVRGSSDIKATSETFWKNPKDVDVWRDAAAAAASAVATA